MNDITKFKCELCGTTHVYQTNECAMCGWKYDFYQNKNHDLEQGLNPISFNKYKRVYFLDGENILDDKELLHMSHTIKALYTKNQSRYDSISEDELNEIILSNKKESDYPPYKCKVCGLGDIESSYDICLFCGWEDDDIQNTEPDFDGGANDMSLNQYKKFWEENKEEILANLKNNRLYAIEKSQEYYKQHFKN